MEAGGETVQTWMTLEKPWGDNQSYFAVRDNVQWKLSAFPVTISACRNTDSLPAPLASWMFSLRKLKSWPPAWGLLQRCCQHNQFSWAGLIASISEEAVEHSGASCLMKQVAVVIKKTPTSIQIWAWLQLWPFSLRIGPTAGWWGNPDQAHPKSHSALET